MFLCSFISFRGLHYYFWYRCKWDCFWGVVFFFFSFLFFSLLFFSNLSFCGVIIGVYRRNRFRYIDFVFFLWTRGLLCRLGCTRPHPLPTRSLQFPKPLEDSWGVGVGGGGAAGVGAGMGVVVEGRFRAIHSNRPHSTPSFKCRKLSVKV